MHVRFGFVKKETDTTNRICQKLFYVGFIHVSHPFIECSDDTLSLSFVGYLTFQVSHLFARPPSLLVQNGGIAKVGFLGHFSRK